MWGGGHGKWQDTGYDCSGSVSFVLAAAGLLSAPLASGPLMSWGEPGKGKWVTIYANDGHVFLEVAGIRFDTSAAARHRLALDQRDALHGGLRGAASRRSLGALGPWGGTPCHPFGVGPITRGASSLTPRGVRLMSRFAHAHTPFSTRRRSACWPRWMLRGSGLRTCRGRAGAAFRARSVARRAALRAAHGGRRGVERLSATEALALACGDAAFALAA